MEEGTYQGGAIPEKAPQEKVEAPVSQKLWLVYSKFQNPTGGALIHLRARVFDITEEPTFNKSN